MDLTDPFEQDESLSQTFSKQYTFHPSANLADLLETSKKLSELEFNEKGTTINFYNKHCVLSCYLHNDTGDH